MNESNRVTQTNFLLVQTKKITLCGVFIKKNTLDFIKLIRKTKNGFVGGLFDGKRVVSVITKGDKCHYRKTVL